MNTFKAQVKTAVDAVTVDFGGGCSASKGYLMAWLIRKYRVLTSADIGVYRGRSLVPQAIAHTYTGGRVYGIDPWANFEAKENDTPLKEAIGKFVDGTDFSAIFEDVKALVRESQLANACVLRRQRSSEAAAFFAEHGIRFGLVHVDGNHDTASVMADVSLYMDLLLPGGFVVMDDVGWASVKPVCELVQRKMTMVYSRSDQWNDYSVYWDAPSAVAALRLKAALLWVGRG